MLPANSTAMMQLIGIVVVAAVGYSPFHLLWSVPHGLRRAAVQSLRPHRVAQQAYFAKINAEGGINGWGGSYQTEGRLLLFARPPSKRTLGISCHTRSDRKTSGKCCRPTGPTDTAMYGLVSLRRTRPISISAGAFCSVHFLRTGNRSVAVAETWPFPGLADIGWRKRTRSAAIGPEVGSRRHCRLSPERDRRFPQAVGDL
jgi:hypothetical protein